MIKKQLEDPLSEALRSVGIEAKDIPLERPTDPARGDISTNIALTHAKAVGLAPRELADKIVNQLQGSTLKKHREILESVVVAGPGFINFFLSRDFFSRELVHIIANPELYGSNQRLVGNKVMIEYTDPNPFKEFHIGHLMSNTIGESLSRILEFSGAEIKRACYQGDVGLHVAKALYGALHLKPKTVGEWGRAYAHGATKYETDERAKKAIDAINKSVYERNDATLNVLYDSGREVSLQHFEHIYKRLGTKFDYYFFESALAKPGLEIVREHLARGVFESSDGAVIFRAEKHNPRLHTRVFITSLGLPTYEAKELALHMAKEKEYPSDLSIVVTASEQVGVFAVGLEALRQIDKRLADKTLHIRHGMLRLPSGKMSSRKGDVMTAESLLDEVGAMVREKIKEREFLDAERNKIATDVAVGAVKYSILRQAIGGDIIYDLERSISFEGDSGPYLQYSHARAHSVLRRAAGEHIKADTGVVPDEMPLLARLLPHFPAVVERSFTEYHPHHIVTYLTELAAEFNTLYARQQFVSVGDPHSPYYVALITAFVAVMKRGLWLLGIEAPAKM